MALVVTYGTFDLLHVGHVNLLRRARALGDRLVVGLSSDNFNALKHKRATQSYADREVVLRAIRYVDDVFPEHTWEQKAEDILRPARTCWSWARTGAAISMRCPRCARCATCRAPPTSPVPRSSR